jgi:hypothetical protein
MQRIPFPYTVAHVKRGNRLATITYRPILPTVLTSENGTILECPALVDSGADACLFPLYVAQGLNLDLTTLPRSVTGGVGNLLNVTFHAILTVDLGHGIRFRAEVGFTEGMNRAGFGLLGQQGFFENYNVEFRHRDRVFTIETA